MTDEQYTAARFGEMAEQCYARGRYVYSDFLSPAEQELFFRAARDFSYVPCTLSGGTEGCERQMVRFGDEETLGYAPEPFPIVCLRVFPRAPKFAEPFDHRDVLGACLHLGVERRCLGDILLRDGEAFVFCTPTVSPLLCAELVRVKRTDVCIEEAPPPAAAYARTEEMVFSCASERLDGLCAGVFHLSRGDASDLFSGGRVFVNGRLCEKGERAARAGEVISVRGHGRFLYDGAEGVSRKGKLRVRVRVYR